MQYLWSNVIKSIVLYIEELIDPSQKYTWNYHIKYRVFDENFQRWRLSLFIVNSSPKVHWGTAIFLFSLFLGTIIWRNNSVLLQEMYPFCIYLRVHFKALPYKHKLINQKLIWCSLCGKRIITSLTLTTNSFTLMSALIYFDSFLCHLLCQWQCHLFQKFSP